MDQNLFLPLSFIGGPAILMNACAILQNGASIRYTLAINLWREMRSESSKGEGTLIASYTDPARAARLATSRIRLLILALNLLYLTIGFFGIATLSGLVGSFLPAIGMAHGAEMAIVLVLIAASVASLGLLSAMIVFLFESKATLEMSKLQSAPYMAKPSKAARLPERGGD